MSKKLVIESKVITSEASGEGAIEMSVTTFGKREGEDGRKFWYKPEGFKEFADAINSGDKAIPICYQHESSDLPVGVLNKATLTDEGLSMSGRLYTETSRGSDLYKMMKSNPEMLSGVSIGAFADDYVFVNEDGNPSADGDYFQITKGGANEVSIVLSPNNPKAMVNNLEYFFEDGNPNLKFIEKRLRDECGLTIEAAKSAAVIFKEALAQHAVVEKAPEELPVETRDETTAEIITNQEEAEVLAALELYELSKALKRV